MMKQYKSTGIGGGIQKLGLNININATKYLTLRLESEEELKIDSEEMRNVNSSIWDQFYNQVE